VALRTAGGGGGRPLRSGDDDGGRAAALLHGEDPRVILRPHPGRWAWLKQGLGMQYSASKRIITDPKGPKRSSPWWTFIKDLRRS
jgi:hypothetical protein